VANTIALGSVRALDSVVEPLLELRERVGCEAAAVSTTRG